MDYPCAKFGDCTFSCIGFIVQINSRQTQTQIFTLLMRLLSARVISGRMCVCWCDAMLPKIRQSRFRRDAMQCARCERGFSRCASSSSVHPHTPHCHCASVTVRLSHAKLVADDEMTTTNIGRDGWAFVMLHYMWRNVTCNVKGRLSNLGTILSCWRIAMP